MSTVGTIDFGAPQTLGELRRILEPFTDEARLAVRNGPLPRFGDDLIVGEPHAVSEDTYSMGAATASEKIAAAIRAMAGKGEK